MDQGAAAMVIIGQFPKDSSVETKRRLTTDTVTNCQPVCSMFLTFFRRHFNGSALGRRLNGLLRASKAVLAQQYHRFFDKGPVHVNKAVRASAIAVGCEKKSLKPAHGNLPRLANCATTQKLASQQLSSDSTIVSGP
jgi:hypothetical protein